MTDISGYKAIRQETAVVDADLDLKGGGGGGFVLLALPACLVSVISFFFKPIDVHHLIPPF